MLKSRFILCFLFGVILSFSMGCRKESEREVHLIPDGFRGIVYIVYEQADGKPKKYDNKGNRIYEIPFSGILKTQFKYNAGSYKPSWRKFYYVDKESHKVNELKYTTIMHTQDTIKRSNIKDSVLVKDLSDIYHTTILDSLRSRETALRVSLTSYVIDIYKDEKIYPKLMIEDLK